MNNKQQSERLNRNKSQSTIGINSKPKYELSQKESFTVKNVNLKNLLNASSNINCGVKSDTYESVCPIEDVAERTKQSQKNSVIRNNLDYGSTGNTCNIFHPTCNDGNTCDRQLKRVSSAPPIQNIEIGMFHKCKYMYVHMSISTIHAYILTEVHERIHKFSHHFSKWASTPSTAATDERTFTQKNAISYIRSHELLY